MYWCHFQCQRRKYLPSTPMTPTATSPELLHVEFKRAWIDARDTAPALALLAPLSCTHHGACAAAGRVLITFGGYAAEPRELWDIPEVRAWFAELTQRFPYWLMFCEPDGSTLALVFNLLLPTRGAAVVDNGKVMRHYAPGQVAELVERQFIGMNRLCAALGVDPEHHAAWSTSAIAGVKKTALGSDPLARGESF